MTSPKVAKVQKHSNNDMYAIEASRGFRGFQITKSVDMFMTFMKVTNKVDFRSG